MSLHVYNTSSLPDGSFFGFGRFTWLMGPEYHSCLDRPSDEGLGKASAERLTTGPRHKEKLAVGLVSKLTTSKNS